LEDNRLKQIQILFAEQIAENMSTFGLPSTLGRVLGIIYLNRRPMTLSELSEATGMSKTRMSQVVRELAELGIAEKVFTKGVRQDLYDVERDYYQIFISLFTETWRRMIRNNRRQEKRIYQELTELLNKGELSEDDQKTAEDFLQESRKHLDYFNWISQLIEFFDDDEVFRYLPRK
jgi:DNA-binding transcriptional regulator GbsR (MarR family)